MPEEDATPTSAECAAYVRAERYSCKMQKAKLWNFQVVQCEWDVFMDELEEGGTFAVQGVNCHWTNVPEPASYTLLAFGLILLAIIAATRKPH